MAKIAELEGKLKHVWTDERRQEHERGFQERIAQAELERDRINVQYRSLDEAMLRKEKDYKRLLDEKKELEAKFNDHKRNAGEKLGKLRADYDMQERRHQKILIEEHNKVPLLIASEDECRNVAVGADEGVTCDDGTGHRYQGEVGDGGEEVARREEEEGRCGETHATARAEACSGNAPVTWRAECIMS